MHNANPCNDSTRQLASRARANGNNLAAAVARLIPCTTESEIRFAARMEQPSKQNENDHRAPRVSGQSVDQSKEPFQSSNRSSHDKSQGTSNHSASSRADGHRRSHKQTTSDRKQSVSNRRRSAVAADEGVHQESSALPKKAAGTPRHRALISCCKGETHTHREEFRYHQSRMSIVFSIR